MDVNITISSGIGSGNAAFLMPMNSQFSSNTPPSEEQALSSTMRDLYQVTDVLKLLDSRPVGISIAKDSDRVIQTGGVHIRSSDRPDIILPPVPDGSGKMGGTRRQRIDTALHNGQSPQNALPHCLRFLEPSRHTSASPIASQPLLQPILQPTPNTITINLHPSGPSASSLLPPLPTRKPIPRTSHPPTRPPTRKKRKQKTATHSDKPKSLEQESKAVRKWREKQKEMEEAKERLRVELSMLTPDNAASDSHSWKERVERDEQNTISATGTEQTRSASLQFVASLFLFCTVWTGTDHIPCPPCTLRRPPLKTLPKSSGSVFSDRSMGLKKQKRDTKQRWMSEKTSR
ncbi:hypothetical protein BLNAU_14299 [Blattamonas nauphoetae]|uniref:Uncharacterized protein n=1 Tax=Blattamonas nauphoetae TaxID=2049346 RepID=A0ABQ9XKV8_9EUKA|nr:hypothetical protein BLNAU_14299 [Blattamonas nauphoetae]